MAKRLAMVACEGDFDTPWTRATGLESSAEVAGLSVGDNLTIIAEHQTDGIVEIVQLQEGKNPLRSVLWRRYKVSKQAGPESRPTTVEIYLDAAHH